MSSHNRETRTRPAHGAPLTKISGAPVRAVGEPVPLAHDTACRCGFHVCACPPAVGA